jgi:hypothetical protein
LKEKTLSAHARALFIATLQPYSLHDVQMAVHAYLADPAGRFLPMPADIVAKINAGRGDGRPGPEEAWAIALRGEDEAETVVWTSEIAEALAISRPVIESCGAMSARKTFLESYERLVAGSRRDGVPVKWSASLGWDLRKREAALTTAAAAGLLPAPTVAAMLPPPAAEAAPQDANARAQLDKIRKMLADMNAEKDRERELHAQRERDATKAAKDQQNELAANYKRDDAA